MLPVTKPSHGQQTSNHRYHLLAVLLLALLALTLAACSGRGTPAATAEATLPPPPKLPTRAATPGAAAPAPAPTAGPTAVATSTAAVEPAATSIPGEPDPDMLPGAYASGDTAFFSQPGSGQLAVIPAGARVGLLGRNADSTWLQALYQPDPRKPAQTGWVRTAAVTAFTELKTLALAGETVAAPTPAATGNASTGTASGPLTVLANRLNLRRGPGTNEAVVGSLAKGEQVSLMRRSPDGVWAQVQKPDGVQGWAAAAYLSADGVAPLAAALPPSTASRPQTASSSSTAKGQIVFQTRGGGDIYIMNADGSGRRRLTSGFDPALSPDGKQVAFGRWEEPRGLWIINTDGTGERLVYGANRPRSPTWSPDGGTIVFEEWTGSKACRQTPFGCLTDDEIRAQIGGDCLKTSFGTFCIKDFPFINRDFTSLVSYNLADGGVRNLKASDSSRSPVFNPGGGSVLFFDNDSMATTSLTGNEQPRPLVTLPNQLGPAVYSPDGQAIYSARRNGDNWNIWRWQPDGGQPVALTAPPALRDRPFHSVSPTLSPDGRTILFLTNRTGKWEMWQMNTDGSNQRPFAPAALSGLDFQYSFTNERIADWG